MVTRMIMIRIRIQQLDDNDYHLPSDSHLPLKGTGGLDSIFKRER
jgi:hypothetical protein